jgi:hypothetical protein
MIKVSPCVIDRLPIIKNRQIRKNIKNNLFFNILVVAVSFIFYFFYKVFSVFFLFQGNFTNRIHG